MEEATRNSVFQVVAFLIEGQQYGLSLPAVERVLPMVAVAPLPQAPAVALGVINIHGQVVPALDIRRRFGLPPREFGIRAHLLAGLTEWWLQEGAFGW